ncbi:MAG: pyridoxamine 5'-phosphate oxidase [Cellvibrionaceae bacterium]
MDLFEFRRDYMIGGLRRNDLNDNPIIQFEQWLNEIVQFGTVDPTAMVLATVDTQQRPHQRIVLLKKVDQDGFVFFTNKDSDKAIDIKNNAEVGLHFPWHAAERQVKVNGVAAALSFEDSQEYFHRRPRESQLAAVASAQSKPLTSRQQLMEQYSLAQSQYPESIPMPKNWGGYRVAPHMMEFWQGGEHRLHDRFVYKRANARAESEWSIQRLSP